MATNTVLDTIPVGTIQVDLEYNIAIGPEINIVDIDPEVVINTLNDAFLAVYLETNDAAVGAAATTLNQAKTLFDGGNTDDGCVELGETQSSIGSANIDADLKSEWQGDVTSLATFYGCAI